MTSLKKAMTQEIMGYRVTIAHNHHADDFGDGYLLNIEALKSPPPLCKKAFGATINA